MHLPLCFLAFKLRWAVVLDKLPFIPNFFQFPKKRNNQTSVALHVDNALTDRGRLKSNNSIQSALYRQGDA